MSGKNKPANLGSLITSEDIQAYYIENPLPASKAEAHFPLVKSMKTTWKTLSNTELKMNEAADPISMNSSVPVAGRGSFKTIIGEMASFGKGREMDADEIERFEILKMDFAQLQNANAAAALINHYGGDLDFVRNAMRTEMSYLSWSLFSNACNIEFVASNSPYMSGLTAMDYADGMGSWQKDDTATSWANAAAEILDDIESVRETGKTYGKYFNYIWINDNTLKNIRNNTQIQKYCATLVQNLYSTQAPPTLSAINAMMSQYFETPIQFVVIDEVVTRASRDGVKVTANPFQDNVAIFTTQAQLGHFEWNALPIEVAAQETYESFFVVGNYKKIDPNYSKIYAKGRGFPVIDTYADNFYLKTNAEAW
jgi:hypothetical protein